MEISQERQDTISRLIAARYEKSKFSLNVEEDAFWDVKASEYAAAVDPSTPSLILTKLAQDAVENLRWRVAINISTPIEVLDKMVLDSDEYVSMCAIKNRTRRKPLSELFENDYDGSKFRAKLFLATDSETPIEVLNTLAHKSDDSTLLEFARSPSTRVELLDMLARNSEILVKRAVAGNPSTPVEVRNILAQQSGIWVKRIASENPSTPVEVGNPNVHERSWEYKKL